MKPMLSVLCNNDFPVLAHNIGLSFLTILIPVAISILNDKEFKELDKHVILDYITQSKKILIYILLVFAPFLFWENSSLEWRMFEISIWVLGLIFITQILYKSYFWMKGNKFHQRFEYLKTLSSTKDMEEVWKSVWETEDINSPNEKLFFDIFSSKIDKML